MGTISYANFHQRDTKVAKRKITAKQEGVHGVSGGLSPGKCRRKDRRKKSRLTIEQILAWADAHKKRTGTWPTAKSGPVHAAPSERWNAINSALHAGCRGLPEDSSLHMLLAEHRGVLRGRTRPPLTIKQILAWADAHKKRTGKWPTAISGPVHAAPGERWSAINSALRLGCRGLAGGLSLVRLLAKHRGVWTRHTRPPLTIKQILAWADAHKNQTGKWPNVGSGPVHGDGVCDETWLSINGTLREGCRGLPGGSSLALLLVKQRGARNNTNVPRLSERIVLQWAKTYREITGRWPTNSSQANPASPDNRWPTIDNALREGHRGLEGGLSIARLLNWTAPLWAMLASLSAYGTTVCNRSVRFRGMCEACHRNLLAHKVLSVLSHVKVALSN